MNTALYYESKVDGVHCSSSFDDRRYLPRSWLHEEILEDTPDHRVRVARLRRRVPLATIATGNSGRRKRNGHVSRRVV